MAPKILTLPFILAIMLPKLANTANILITTVGTAGSQNLVMYRLAELMGQRGHNVTIMKADLFPEAKSIPVKHSKELSYSLVDDPVVLDELRSVFTHLPWKPSQNAATTFRQAAKVFQTIHEGCERLLDRDDFIQTLRDSKFDAVVIHMVDLCTFGLTQVLNIDAYVWMSTAMMVDPLAWYSGSPLATSYVPNVIPPAASNGRMSFLERIKNSVASVAMLAVFKYRMVGGYTETFRKKYGPKFPDFDEILRKTQLFFVNADPTFEYARPTPENVVYVGGLTMKNAEPLTQKWQYLLDNATNHGVVIFSLGSLANTSTMPREIRLSFLNAFKRFPHLFIWRFEGAFPEAKSVKNVHLANWLPQKDLMAHPNVKAAIIHGGYNSLTETTYMGVPVVVLPLWGDQYGNAIRVTRHNIGVKLDVHQLSEDKVYEALRKVLHDHRIQDSAKHLGKMIRERPFSSLQQATNWLEYLAKFKRIDQLQPQSHDMYLFQYLLLDVLIVVIATLLLILGFVALIMRLCVWVCNLPGGTKRDGKLYKME